MSVQVWTTLFQKPISKEKEKMDFKPKIGENTFETQSAGNINGDIVYDTNGDTIVTPFQTPNKPIPVIIPKIDKRNYKKHSKLRLDEREQINNVKRELFPSDQKMKSIC